MKKGWQKPLVAKQKQYRLTNGRCKLHIEHKKQRKMLNIQKKINHMQYRAQHSTIIGKKKGRPYQF